MDVKVSVDKGGYFGVDLEMERSGWLQQRFRKQELVWASAWCSLCQRECGRGTAEPTTGT